MSEMLTYFILMLIIAFIFAFIFAWFFRQAIVYFKENAYFLCGLYVAMCIWEAAKLVELCVKM